MTYRAVSALLGRIFDGHLAVVLIVLALMFCANTEVSVSLVGTALGCGAWASAACGISMETTWLSAVVVISSVVGAGVFVIEFLFEQSVGC